jgi:hypothetical protein
MSEVTLYQEALGSPADQAEWDGGELEAIL